MADEKIMEAEETAAEAAETAQAEETAEAAPKK